MTTRRALFFILAAAAASALATPLAAQQPWPQRPIRMVVPYPPGGSTDITARVYAQRLQQVLGQPVVVENKAGAGGEVGAELVANAPPDGYTLLFGAVGSLAIHAVIPSQKPPYELAKAFVGVSMGSKVPLALAARRDLPVDSVAALLAMARSKPGSVTYGSAGNGSTQHMTAELFVQRTDVQLVHVPYTGSAPAVNDLLGGQIDMTFETLPALSAYLVGGKIKVMAVTSAQRTSLLPDVPTLDELDIKGFDVSTYYGLLAPHGTPRDIVARLSGHMQSIAAMPEVQAQFVKQGAEAKASTPEESDSLIRGEVEKWSVVARKAQIN